MSDMTIQYIHCMECLGAWMTDCVCSLVKDSPIRGVIGL